MEIDYEKQIKSRASQLKDVNNFYDLIESVESAKKDKILSVIKEFEAVRNLNIVLFPKTFAFRVGSSSRNVISSYPMGFKGDLKDQRQFIDLISKIEGAKNFIINEPEFKSLILLFFLLYHSDKVKYGEDKTLKAETATISQTESKLRTILAGRDFLHIEIGKEKYIVDSFKKIQGVPKADAAFYYKNQPVIFCSLKNGGSPANFQQYGGWPVDLNIKSRADVRREPSLEKFVSRVENVFKGLGLKPDSSGSYDFNNLKKGSNFAEYLDDPNLAAKVVYGKDYGSTNWGKNNVQIVMDGDIIFKPNGQYYTLEGSFKTSVNPKLRKSIGPFRVDPTDIYAPVLLLAKSESQGLNQGGFKNVRAYIFPNNKVSKAYIAKLKYVEGILKSGDKNKIAKLKQEIVK